MFEKEEIGNATLYLGDCLEVLPTLQKVDCVVTDPPYGIGEAAGKNASRGNLAIAKDYGNDSWDDEPISNLLMDLVVRAGRNAIVFGGNYYPMQPSKCWLVWDKDNGTNDFADCELAWTNLDMAVRRYKFMWNGMLRANKEKRGDHPTQKPIEVMKWCVGFTKGTVLDPFMGSGTTGVACMNLGRKFIGIEIERKYFDIACERIEQAQKQQRLFE